jgi:hypothetical protein
MKVYFMRTNSWYKFRQLVNKSPVIFGRSPKEVVVGGSSKQQQWY